jgi:hypothetical protein
MFSIFLFVMLEITPLQTQLAPVLQPGDVVIADNLSSHKSAKAQRMLKE